METGVCGNCGDDVVFEEHDRDVCTRTSKPCPSCDAPMEKHVGVIEYPALTRFMQIVRRTRLGSFWACGACEHCEEAV